MAMQHTRIVAKVFRQRIPSLTHISQRFHGYNAEGDTSGSPYRPWPLESYFWPTTGEHWTKEYPQQSSTADEYEKEEVYLDEIEERMRKYDRKYSQTDKVKNLYNEFGWENQDDRAFNTYGAPLGQSDALAYGRGKKIDPAQYINPSFTATTRKPIPPVEYLTPEQVRRTRGSLANFRELPPEQPSLWKYWNFYTTFGVFTALLFTKEYFIFGGHDMWDALLYWGTFGMIGAGLADFLSWWHALVSQEHYDREYFMLNDKVKQLNKKIEALATKPNERRLLLNMVAYRDDLAEKVLQKTLSNRVSRLSDAVNKQLSDKLSEETALKRGAESGWGKEAMEETLKYFEDPKVKADFMADALKQFCAKDVASLKTKTAASASPDLFKARYQQSYDAARNKYLKDQKAAGSLSWVFVDAAERAKQHLSKQDKENEFSKRVKSWEQSHNPVSGAPAFA